MTLTHYFFHLNQNVTTDYHQFTHILDQKILTERGWLTISSAEEEANPTQFLATHVKVPASSGKTSLMTRVALLSS